MNIESEIFKRSKVSFDKLTSYGFKEYGNTFVYEKVFFNNDFKAIITINNKGNVSGKVIDLELGEEYLGFRSEMSGEFSNKVKSEYKSILNDIRDNCFINRFYIYDQTNRVNKYIKDRYNNDPEFLFDKSPGCGVYRNTRNKKWYGIIMNIDYSKIDKKTGEIEIINIKLNRNMIKELISEKGFYKAYHMSKVDWISIVLDDTLADEVIFSLIDESYNIINGK